MGARVPVASLSAFLAYTFICPLLCSGAIANFESYPEGSIPGSAVSFTDSASGITFSNPSNAGSPSVFVIEYASSLPLPFFQNNRYLKFGGYAPGPASSLSGYISSFTAVLPIAADTVGIDFAYYPIELSNSLTLTGYDSANQILDTATFSGFFDPTLITSQAIGASSLTLHSATSSIHHFTVSATSLGTGYDNISFTPEPSLLPLAALVSLLLRLRHAQRA